MHELEAEYVQIGNEINHGMMKPFGARDGSGNFQKLIEAGIQGARAANDSVLTFIHYAGFENASSFFATIDSLDFDAIGLSYYPLARQKPWRLTRCLLGFEPTICDQYTLLKQAILSPLAGQIGPITISAVPNRSFHNTPRPRGQAAYSSIAFNGLRYRIAILGR